MSFGSRLRALRKEREWSIYDLSNKARVSKSSISEYENETKIPNAETLIKISKVFNVSIDYLLGQTEDRTIHDPGNRDLVSIERPIINGVPASDADLNDLSRLYQLLIPVVRELKKNE